MGCCRVCFIGKKADSLQMRGVCLGDGVALAVADEARVCDRERTSVV